MTAIEWLVKEANLLENNGWILQLIEKAKEMEKVQIINAYIAGDINGVESMIDFDLDSASSPEEYYNKNYKSCNN
jgi:uncharacterized protein (UPF0254 family)